MASNSIDIKVFDGGLVDDPLDAQPNEFQRADNFLLRPNRRLKSRDGTKLDSLTFPQIPSGITRVQGFPKISTDIYFQVNGRNLYYRTDLAQFLPVGPLPTLNPALPAGDDDSFPAFAEWNKHLILTNDAFGNPQKIYQDGAGTVQIRNAGLPKITLPSMILLANDLKAKLNAHLIDLGMHAHADLVNTITAANAFDYASLVDLISQMLTNYQTHESDAALSSNWLYHIAQESDSHYVAITTAPTTLTECKTFLEALITAFNAHDADADAHTIGSQHQESGVVGPTISGSSGGLQYIYYFCLFYQYTVGSQIFVDRGPTYFVVVPNIVEPSASDVSISNIPAVVNGSTQNFDTSNMYVEIYRTIQNGTTPYYLDRVLNGTTSYTDSIDDDDISDGTLPILYTSGGVYDNDPAPPAKYVVTVNDITWYGHVKEAGQIKKSRIRQSKKFDLDSCPEEFFIDLEDELVGMGVASNFPIAVCTDHLYRLEGFRDTQGNGSIVKQEIARGIGGINHLSIVNTYMGMFFCARTCWYFTDGYTVTKLTTKLRDTYAALVDTAHKRSRPYGMYDPDQNRIYWAMTSNSSSADNDIIYVLDLNYTSDLTKGYFTPIVPASGAWLASSLFFDSVNRKILIGDNRGYIFKFDDTAFGDLGVDTTISPASWLETPLVWNYQGPALSFNDANKNKLATYLTLTADTVTSLSLRVNRQVDNSGFYKPLAEIRSRGSSAFSWMDPTAPSWLPTPDGYPWLTFPMLIEKRRFPKDNLRFLYLQIQITNSNTIIYRSDDLQVADIALVSPGIYSATMSSIFWPFDSVNYFISFESDNYTKRYLITAFVNTALTFVDSSGTVAVGTEKKWQISGVKKGERFNLNTYSIEWEILTASHNQYRGVTGGNT